MEGAFRTVRARDLLTLFLAALCTIMELWLHLMLGITVVYTHLFYPVLVLAAFWYREKAAILALYLGILHVTVSAWLTGALDPGAMTRALLFLIVTLVAGYIAARMEGEYRFMARYLGSRAQRLRRPLEALARDMHGLRKDLGGLAAIRKMRERGNVPGLVAALDYRDPDLRYAAAEALGGIRAREAVPALVRALHDPHHGVRWRAAVALAWMGPDAVPALSAALEDPDADVRWRAAVALGDIGGAGALQHLIRTLGDGDRYVRSRAEQALGRMGPEAVGPLIPLLQDNSPTLRQAAAAALGWTRDAGAAGHLIGALGDGDLDVREAASTALETLGKPAVDTVVRALSHMDPGIRAHAARILGRIGDPAAARPLQDCLTDPDPAVRHAAGEALSALGGEVLEDLFRASRKRPPDMGEDQGL